MGCTSSTPVDDDPLARRAIAPAGAFDFSTPDGKQRVEQWHRAMAPELPPLLDEPVRWAAALPSCLLVMLYLVDLGKGYPDVAIAFGDTKGNITLSFEAAQALGRSDEEHAELQKSVARPWMRLCYGAGELGLDRPARMVVYYLPKQAEGNNLDIDFAWTLDKLGPRKYRDDNDNALKGIHDWYDALKAGGVPAAQAYLDKYKNPNVAEPSAGARIDLSPPAQAEEANVRV
ncbi:uncharacterized protein LOC62_07G008875 [Vanrija pseudolonga]|uniref:Uncharacterized protein n=1 Tax=Vanrija pseudolonga TaxID=143232 RepID=A0AAF1BL31_9TREE|nr:hypothetical protein LOC62_07G008875 [Vanrija pseudolonga]